MSRNEKPLIETGENGNAIEITTAIAEMTDDAMTVIATVTGSETEIVSENETKDQEIPSATEIVTESGSGSGNGNVNLETIDPETMKEEILSMTDQGVLSNSHRHNNSHNSQHNRRNSRTVMASCQDMAAAATVAEATDVVAIHTTLGAVMVAEVVTEAGVDR